VILVAVMNSAPWVMVLLIAVFIVECVQAVIYVPRACRAIAEKVLAPTNQNHSQATVVLR
jgi:hypothetical protein